MVPGGSWKFRGEQFVKYDCLTTMLYTGNHYKIVLKVKCNWIKKHEDEVGKCELITRHCLSSHEIFSLNEVWSSLSSFFFCLACSRLAVIFIRNLGLPDETPVHSVQGASIFAFWQYYLLFMVYCTDHNSERSGQCFLLSQTVHKAGKIADMKLTV